jgi:multidrug efflux system membrane fusion protein
MALRLLSFVKSAKSVGLFLVCVSSVLHPWLLLGLMFASAAGCQQAASQAPAERPPALVAVATAQARDVPIYLDEIGRCVAREMVSVQPQVSGRITEIHFADGAELKPGDLLFTIDPRPYEAALNQAKAALKQNEAALDLARIEFTRVKNLTGTRSASREEYETKRNAVEVAEAQVAAAQAAVQTAALNVEYCSIRSPIIGRAGHRLLDVGNVVNPNGNSNAPLLMIERLDPIYADFTVTENDLSTVQENGHHATLRAEVRLPDRLNEPRIGDVTFVDNTVQEGTGTVMLRATLANADRLFWPGRFVKVRLILKTENHAVLIPATATQVSATGPFVYVIKDDSTAELRPVVLGQRHGDLVLVRSGVKPGERVVTLGQLAVMPGAKVRIEETPTNQTAKRTGDNGENRRMGSPKADADGARNQ